MTWGPYDWGLRKLLGNGGRTTKQQIEDLPVKRRGTYMTPEGDLVVIELRKCPLTGLELKRTVTYK